MKKFKIKIHVKILIALVFGAAFGAFFNVNVRLLEFTIIENNSKQVVHINDWKNIIFKTLNDITSKDSIKESSFEKGDQIQIIKYYQNLPEKDKSKTVIIVDDGNQRREYLNVASIEKIGTIATYIKPVGTLFIRLLSFLAIPLVIASLIVGAASIEDIKKIGRIGLKTFTMFIVTTAISIIIGLILANMIRPGEKISEQSKNRLIGAYNVESTSKAVKNIDINIVDFFIELVPTNPINAMAEGKMLQIVFFAVMFGITLTFIDRKKSEPLIKFFDGVSDTMIKMVDFIMIIAPYGVFALISATIAEFGFEIISTLFWYIFTVLLGLVLQLLIVYSFLVKFYGKMSPFKFFKGMQAAQAIAFSTSSSAATLPVNFECTEINLGIPKQITGFVLPLGATINMDGTALYQGVAAIFIAQVYGMDLNIIQQLTIIFTAVLASIGTAPVPGVGIIMLVMILESVHVPVEGIALIFGVDRLLDMCRTVVNITGDAAVAAAVAGTEKLIKA